MIAIGRYLVFIIYLAGLALSVEGPISEVDKKKFLDDIFKLHNMYRREHRAVKLKRTRLMDSVAAQLLDDTIIGQYHEDYDVYGKIIHEIMYDRYTKLDFDEAETIVLRWYGKGRMYNYFSEPSDYESYNEFTQIVWQDTQWIGIALKWMNDKYVVQIVYYPRGNIPGLYKNNVLQRPIIAHIRKSVLNVIVYENVIKNFEDYIVYLHNEARIKHGVPILQRDTKLDVFAYKILHLISRQKSQYHGMYGKNYLERRYDDNTLLDEAEAKAIFLKWYKTGRNYNYSVEPSKKKADAFTRIVWMGTQTIGISILREEGFYRVLVFYNPPGNIKEEFVSNIRMPQSMEQGESSSYIDN